MKKLIVAALLAAVASPAMAQAQAAAPAAAALPDADPAVWVVKDEDTTIYLFGTFHMLDGKSAWFNDEVKTAFDASQEVVLEAILPENLADMMPLIQKYAVDPEGRKLSERLPEPTKARFEKELNAVGVPAAAIDAFEPWFASMTLTSIAAQKLGLTGEHGPEAVLTKAAKAKGMPVGELESADMQLSMFDKMPDAMQIKFLDETLEQMGTIESTLKPMLTAWSSGDTDSLVKILNQGLEDDPELYETLLTKRNANWAEWIDARMDKPGTVFVAVGAGHLAGKDSVQDLLSKRGIKSSRVTQ